MDFRVELTDQAKQDIAALYAWLQSQHAGDAGARWFTALRAAITSLTNLPARCSLAPESRDSPLEVRQLVVHVLHIRHGRRRPAPLAGAGLPRIG